MPVSFFLRGESAKMRIDVKGLKPETIVQTYDYVTKTEGIMVIDNTALGP